MGLCVNCLARGSSCPARDLVLCHQQEGSAFRVIATVCQVASIMSVVIKFSRPDSVHRCKLRVLRADYLPITLAGAHETSVVRRGKAVGTYDYGFRISAALEQLWIRSLRMDLLDCIRHSSSLCSRCCSSFSSLGAGLMMEECSAPVSMLFSLPNAAATAAAAIWPGVSFPNEKSIASRLALCLFQSSMKLAPMAMLGASSLLLQF